MRTAITTLFTFAIALVTLLPSVADAQCCSSPYTVGYAPVQTAAPAVYQTTYYNGYSGWYPGKNVINFTRSLFGAPTQPTYGTAYTAGYAPVANTYSVGYAPQPVVRAAYRPTYPLTYGPVMQTVSRPVVLSPVTSCNVCSSCDPCGSCNTCSGVTQASFYSGSTSSCSSCSPSSTVYADQPASATYEPQPALRPNENPSAERSLFESNKPEVKTESDVFDDASSSDSDEAYFQAPPLFKPQDRLTSRHPAPVWNAVHSTIPGRQAVAKPVTKSSSTSHQVGATGWGSSVR